MPYSHNIDLCLRPGLASGGTDRPTLDVILDDCVPVLEELCAASRDGSLPFLAMPEKSDDLEICRRHADDLLRGATDMVIIGTGGSSLGAQALGGLKVWGTSSLGHPASDGQAAPIVHFMDNLDPWSMAGLLATLDLKTTRFLVISKSGGTSETLIQTLAVLDALKASGLEWNAEHHILALTEPAGNGANPLRELCARHHVPVIDHEPGLGGRYSVLSNVGFLPALFMGLDPYAVRQGAADVVTAMLEAAHPRDSAPFVGAALHHSLNRSGRISTVVMMPYADRLRRFSNWFVQLWAESLGKGGRGSTPIASAGPVDQHSQLQLFLDGPDDKMFTLITLDVAGTGPRIDEGYRNDPGLGYLAGKSIGDLVDCQQRATAHTLADKGRPVRVISLSELNESAMGALLMHFMIETVVAGRLMGVDPFDQPAVEDGKHLAREYLAQM